VRLREARSLKPVPWAFVLLAFTWSLPAAAGAPRALKGPYLTGFSSSAVDVRVELDAEGPAAVEVKRAGADAHAPVRVVDAASTSMHVLHVKDLEPHADYTYEVRSGSTSLGGGRFSTAAADASSPVTFLVYGDDRTDPTAHAGVVRAMLTTPADFLVNTGDVVADGGSSADWQGFFDIEAPLLRDRPFLLAIGNHELFDDAAGANFARYFGFFDERAHERDASSSLKAYGTTRVGATRFFFLNGMHDWDGGEERQWLEAELARADKEPGLQWRIAVVHHGPASSGPHGPNAKLLAAHIPEFLAAHHVDILFSGHDHIYDRGVVDNLKYVVSGGGGAPLYEIATPAPTSLAHEVTYHFVEVAVGEGALHTITHRADGSIVEKCTVQHALPWDCTAGTPAVALAKAAAPAAAAAPASAPALAAPPSTSHSCGCSVLGARSPEGPFEAMGVLALAGLAGLGARASARRTRRRS
jgi:hypothetical protein